MGMSYADLLKELQQFTPEQLAQTVTVYVQGVDEWYGLEQSDLRVTDDTVDVLDPGQKYFVI